MTRRSSSATRRSTRPGDIQALTDFELGLWGAGVEQPVERLPVGLQGFLRPMIEAANQGLPRGRQVPLDPPAAERLDRLTMPVLFVHGALDFSYVETFGRRSRRTFQTLVWLSCPGSPTSSPPRRRRRPRGWSSSSSARSGTSAGRPSRGAIGGMGQELGEVVGRGRASREASPRRRDGRRPLPRAAPAPRRGSRGSGRRRRRVVVERRPSFRHCQSCERLISAVAASSIRLLIAAAPLPPSQRRGTGARPDVRAGRRLRSPGRPRRAGPAASRRRPTTSSRRRSIWFGAAPSTPSKISVASRHEVRVRDPRAVEAVAGLALLVLADVRDRRRVHLRSRRLGMNAAMPPMAWAPCR